jgi:hypothetical protein
MKWLFRSVVKPQLALILGLGLILTAGCGRAATVSSRGAQVDDNKRQVAPLPTILPAPAWQIGDWFELKVSEWRGRFVAFPPEEMDWDPPVILRFEVVGEETLLGYPCFVLSETWPNGDVRTETMRYVFRKSDMSLLCERILVRHIDREMTLVEQYGQSPWAAHNLGLAPRFPAGEGIKVIPPSPLLDASGKRVQPRSEAESWERPKEKSQRAMHDKMTHLKNTNNLIQIEYDRYVCRWRPGQIWWAQCWQQSDPTKDIKTGNGGSRYRAALYATSRDGILDYPLPAAARGGIIQERKLSAPAEP